MLKLVTAGDYYVDMAVAWAMSVVGVKYYDILIKTLKDGCFCKFTHNKTIQKCRESFRYTAQQKEELLSLKRKDA